HRPTPAPSSPLRAAAPPPRSPPRRAARGSAAHRSSGPRCSLVLSPSSFHFRNHRHLRALHYRRPAPCSACGQHTSTGEGRGPILAGGKRVTQRGAPGRPQHDGSRGEQPRPVARDPAPASLLCPFSARSNSTWRWSRLQFLGHGSGDLARAFHAMVVGGAVHLIHRYFTLLVLRKFSYGSNCTDTRTTRKPMER
ncbi:unnamed protein product, partial [Urochloa humidicola]